MKLYINVLIEHEIKYMDHYKNIFQIYHHFLKEHNQYLIELVIV